MQGIECNYWKTKPVKLAEPVMKCLNCLLLLSRNTMELAKPCGRSQETRLNLFSRIGFEPKTIRRNDYWYLSPLRNEKTPSFRITRKLNVWYDHGMGKGEQSLISAACILIVP
jgi:hypothetical protein